MADDHDPPDDHDPDLEDEAEVVLTADATPGGAAFVGYHPTFAAYFHSLIEDQIDPSVHWLMDCLDWDAVQRRMEADRFHYLIENNRVYRVKASDG